jgi:hypothetical protein
LFDLSVMNCARFRCVRRSVIVRFVRVRCALRARFVVTILSLALAYAFACSGACALCMGASAAAATQTHECGHATDGAAGDSQHQAPAKPDCVGHHHSGFEAVQSDGLSRFELSTTSHASQVFDGADRSEVLNVGASLFSDLAPPRLVATFAQQNNSILRI